MMIFLWHNLRLLSPEHLGQIQIPLPWWLCRQCWVHGIKIQWVESTWGGCFVLVNNASCFQIRTTYPLALILIALENALTDPSWHRELALVKLQKAWWPSTPTTKTLVCLVFMLLLRWGHFLVWTTINFSLAENFLFWQCVWYSFVQFISSLCMTSQSWKNWILILIEFYYILFYF